MPIFLFAHCAITLTLQYYERSLFFSSLLSLTQYFVSLFSWAFPCRIGKSANTVHLHLKVFRFWNVSL